MWRLELMKSLRCSVVHDLDQRFICAIVCCLFRLSRSIFKSFIHKNFPGLLSTFQKTFEKDTDDGLVEDVEGAVSGRSFLLARDRPRRALIGERETFLS